MNTRPKTPCARARLYTTHVKSRCARARPAGLVSSTRAAPVAVAARRVRLERVRLSRVPPVCAVAHVLDDLLRLYGRRALHRRAALARVALLCARCDSSRAAVGTLTAPTLGREWPRGVAALPSDLTP
eukprot:6222080-Prymnesium_polylepis.1